jgi:nucleoside-diphosphate-sugar epimerase
MSEGTPRILVTGASGRIGRRTVEALIRAGFSVRALTSRIPSQEIEGVEWRIHDLRQADLDFRQDARGCVGIVHLAAEQANVDDMYRVNAEATGALAEAAESESVPVMVYTSTMSVYGSPTVAVVTEDAPVLTADRDVPSEYWEGPDKRAYGRTKLQGELAIKAAARKVEYVVFRPTAVYAPADLVDMAGWSTRARVVLWKQRSHAINVDDVAQAIVWALQRALTRKVPAPGVSIYNLSDEATAQTYGTIWQAFNDAIDPPPSGVPVALPPWLGWLLYWLWYRGRPRRLVGQCALPASKLEGEGFTNIHGLDPLIERAVEQAKAASS